MIFKRNRIYFIRKCCFCIPASNRVRRIQRNLHIGNGNFIVAYAFLRRADSALIIHEENIVNLLEDWIQVYITGCAD